MEETINGETVLYKNRIVLSQSILKKKPNLSTIPAYPLITTVMRIARRALDASASSILVSEECSQRLMFAFADGSSAEQIKRLKISKNSGIAGLVANNGKSLIVNDAYENKYFNNFLDRVTGQKTKSMICAPLVVKDKIIGVIEMINKLNGSDFSERDLRILEIIAAPVAQMIENIRLSHSNLVGHNMAISMLLSTIGAVESSISEHAKRVSQYALAGATALSLSSFEKQVMKYAAVLHDIGKLRIPAKILDKHANLDPEERTMLHKHPIIGFNMLKGIDFLQEASKSILYHHEQYDGSGYPKGLRGNAIPVGARLIAVSDAFDNMTAVNSHHSALSKKDALMELHKYAGTKFAPAVISAFNAGIVSSLTSGSI